MGPHGMLMPWLYTQCLSYWPCSLQTSSDASMLPQHAPSASWRATANAGPHSLRNTRMSAPVQAHAECLHLGLISSPTLCKKKTYL